ncbi:Sulfurtransferase [bioreactor metagenome]|uniref:Sulfurtransferase n=1 Tax=bioreactor metagenome TaxID=1076179 RepID=A0A645J493_9ZZZZ
MKKALDDPASRIKVLDVREVHEYAIARVPGTVLLPLSELRRRFAELDPNCEYFIHCKAGVRSRQAQQFLAEHGFKHLKNVRGGILAWSREIDSSVPEY